MIYFSRMEPNCLLLSSRDTHKLAQLKRKNTNTKIPFCWVQNLSTNILANCKNHLIHKQSQQLATPTTSNERGHCPSWTPPFLKPVTKKRPNSNRSEIARKHLSAFASICCEKEVIKKSHLNSRSEQLCSAGVNSELSAAQTTTCR